MTRGDEPPKLQALDDRLRAARARERSERDEPEESALPGESGAGVGYRVGVELFAGMLFGGGIGWLLDRWLGTKPWLMVVLFLLGAGAGLLNSYRAVMQANRSAPVASGPKEGSDGKAKD